MRRGLDDGVVGLCEGRLTPLPVAAIVGTLVREEGLGDDQMADAISRLEARIALARRNISELTERAAVANGAAAEERLANLLSDQQDLLNGLIEEREAAETKAPR